MTERMELILAAFFGNILAQVARYAYHWWQAMQRPRWKCPECQLLMITRNEQDLRTVRNIHHDQTGHGIGVTPH